MADLQQAHYIISTLDTWTVIDYDLIQGKCLENILFRNFIDTIG